MVNTIGTQSSVVSGVNASVTFTVGTFSNVYAIAKTFSAKWGNNLDEEGVVGTDIPIINTNQYHGEIDLDIGYSTENTGNAQFTTLMIPANGQITAISMVWTGKDVSSITRTFTLTSTVWPKSTEVKMSGPSMVRSTFSAVLTQRPVLT